MKEKVGFIAVIKCLLKKTDIEIIESLAKKTGLSCDDIKDMMAYNMFTVNQFSNLTGLSVSSILNKTRETVIDGNIGTELNYCHPFRDKKFEGPKFIVRDVKSEKFIDKFINR